MVGFLRSTATEGVKAEEEEDIIKNQSLSDSKKTTDLCIPELDDFPSSFSDSFLDLESLNGWFMEGNAANMADLPVDFDLLRGELGDIKKEFDVFGDGICLKNETGEDLGGTVESLWGGVEQEEGEIGVVERSAEMGSERTNAEGVVGGVVCERSLGDIGCLIEEQLGKVNLDGQSNSLVSAFASVNCENSGDGSKSVQMAVGSCDSAKSDGVDNVAAGNVVGVSGNEIKVDQSVGDGEESGSGEESEDESSGSSSSSSSSSSSEEEEDEDSGKMCSQKKSKIKKGKNEKGSDDEQTEIEDGEIMLSDAEEMIAWSDIEDDEGGGGGGPIKSKNELKVLPPVPTVNVTLKPHHETLPVGTILSVVGPQVIVEGVEKHNPLNEGSILWITENRSPLGIIDEIFGPVKNPYYIVRYNSENEVPSGIQQGTLISFVAEFADHVLNDKSLYQKGYDASNENDEELSDDVEFSDDEKEAEHKRMLKMKKRGTNEPMPGNKRKDKKRQLKNQKGSWNNNGDPAAQTPRGGSNLPVVTEEHHFTPPFGASLNQDNHQCSSGPKQGFAGDQAPIPPFPHRPQAPGFPAPNGSWNNGFPQQNANLLSGLPPNGMLWMQQSLPYLYPTPLQTGAAFQQQIGMIPGLPPNFNAMAGQPNFGGTLPPWPMNQNALNPSQFGMDLQPQHGSLPLSGAGDQGVQSQGSQDSHNMQPPPPAFSYNGGRGGGGRGGGGRRGNHRGRGRFSGGRGRH